jgi:hypothetical protein
LPYEIRIYPPFAPKENPGRIAPGHLIFTADGVAVWGADTKQFLGKHL